MSNNNDNNQPSGVDEDSKTSSKATRENAPKATTTTGDPSPDQAPTAQASDDDLQAVAAGETGGEVTPPNASEAIDSGTTERPNERPKTYHQIIESIERPQMRQIGEFTIGDSVSVQIRIVEGERQRIQSFKGVVIAKRNRGLNSSFRVRKKARSESVERVFQTHSPLIESVKVHSHGQVRRAKLYYLRKLSGLAARIKEKTTAR